MFVYLDCSRTVMSQWCLSSAISISNFSICCLSSRQIFTKVIACSVTARRISISCLLVPRTDSSLQCFITILDLVENILIVCKDDWCWEIFPHPASHISVSQMSTEFSKKNLIFCKMLAVLKICLSHLSSIRPASLLCSGLHWAARLAESDLRAETSPWALFISLAKSELLAWRVKM